MSSPAVAPDGTPETELSFTLDREATEQVKNISEKIGVTPDALIGMALRLMLLTTEAKDKKRRVLLTSDSGYPIKEIVIPAK